MQRSCFITGFHYIEFSTFNIFLLPFEAQSIAMSVIETGCSSAYIRFFSGLYYYFFPLNVI